jgi:hypothetical protein
MIKMKILLIVFIRNWIKRKVKNKWESVKLYLQRTNKIKIIITVPWVIKIKLKRLIIKTKTNK